MSKADFVWVRWDRLRWQFVDAIVKASQHQGRRVPMCDESKCCAELTALVKVMGCRWWQPPLDSDPHFEYLEEIEESVTSSMRDGFTMIRDYIEFQQEHPFDGLLEAPEEIARIANSDYFSRFGREGEIHSSQSPVDEVRELLYAFSSLAFPNEFLELVHRFRSGDGNNSGVNEIVLAGTDAYAELRRTFEKHGYVSPLLSPSIVEGLTMTPNSSVPCTDQFILGDSESRWSELGGYGLEFGMKDASLQKYWESFPSIPDAFCYTERNNGYFLAMGIVCRSLGLFVSQQVGVSFGDDFSKSSWNYCTQSFNQYLSPHLGGFTENGAAMVVFSNFRDSAYIVSSEESSWDEYASLRNVLGPLPEGFGIVGMWSGYDKNRYTPRSLDDVIEANWSDQITASAKYLRDCLKIVVRFDSE